MSRLFRLILAACFCSPFGGLKICRADDGETAESIIVETRSGRVFRGQVDPTTSGEVLAIRSGTASMYIVRPIDWQAIVRLRINGRTMLPAELIRRFESQGWPQHVEELPAPTPPAPARDLPAPSDAEENQQAYYRSAPSLPVAALQIEAGMAKWTSGAENSGIQLRIYPVDSLGNIVPVSGTLEVELIGQQAATLSQGEPFGQLARWGQVVSPADFGANGAVYRFAYQAWHPEVDLQWFNTGAVHARLTVPGQGVFDDTATMVRLRPFSTTRDRLQQYRGHRFFPAERTNRGVVEYGTAQ